MNNRHWTLSFIRYPVWAIVLSVLIFLLGLRSYYLMQIRKFPDVQIGVITIQTSFRGCPADLMQATVTTPLQRSAALADGIDYITASTIDEFSKIQIFLKTDYDIQTAFTNILSKIQAAKKTLPQGVDDPVIMQGTGNSIALMYIAYTSEGVASSKIYDYLNNVIRPQLLTVPGVGTINILGADAPAIRIWLDLSKLEEFNLSLDQIQQALSLENFYISSGEIRSDLQKMSFSFNTLGKNVDYFSEIIIKQDHLSVVKLKDIADIELGSKTYNSVVTFDDSPGVFLSIDTLPTANAITVMKDVRNNLEKLESSLPAELHQKIVYDATDFINQSIDEVVKTIIESCFIVIIVMYFFLGSFRAVIVPLITLPLSIIGVGTFMYLLGFSINLLTLLALILAIGLVVDDAIIVVENTFKKLEKGFTPLKAASDSIVEIAEPIIVMTGILAIAYLPMALLGGLTGGLFKEFAFTLSCAVLISGVIALTLSPLMCGTLLRAHDAHHENLWLKKLQHGYEERLLQFFQIKKFIKFFSFIIILAVVILTLFISKELAPKEDQGFALVSYNAPETATLDYTIERSLKIKDQLKSFPEEQNYFLINGAGTVSSGFGGFIAKPWKDRTRSIDSLESEFRQKFSKIAGMEIFSFTPNSLPGVGGLPFQVVLFGPYEHEFIYLKAQEMMTELKNSGYFPFLTTDIKFNKPVYTVTTDQGYLKSIGLSSSYASSNLFYGSSEPKISIFNYHDQQLDVIAQNKNRNQDIILQKVQIKTPSGESMMANELIDWKISIQPNQRNQFNQLNAVTVQGMMFPLFTIGDALSIVEKIKPSLLENGLFMDYVGPTRSYLQEGNQLFTTALFALIISYMVLCALFQNFKDPIVILLTVPMALFGTLASMNLSALIAMSESLRQYSVTMNIYTQLGLLTLIGLITKHGILIVQVANTLKKEGLSADAASIEAAKIRFRPILMTTVAMVVGVLPLLFASGSGAVSRFHLGFVIATGLGIGTLFTLFIIPVVYSMLGGSRIELQETL